MNNLEIKETNIKVFPNPNTEVLKDITTAIEENEGYCCCAIEKNDDSKCMCKEFRESRDDGFCHCGRFFKVKEPPIITILCHPRDIDEATTIADNLAPQGFIVLTPHYGDEGWYARNKAAFDSLQRSQIFKADLVIVINNSQEAVDFLEGEIYWAEDLQKKIIFTCNEEEENEV